MWIRAIMANNYATWPCLSVKAVQKHFPEFDETAQGHMRGVRQGLRSSKKKIEKTHQRVLSPKNE